MSKFMYRYVHTLCSWSADDIMFYRVSSPRSYSDHLSSIVELFGIISDVRWAFNRLSCLTVLETLHCWSHYAVIGGFLALRSSDVESVMTSSCPKCIRLYHNHYRSGRFSIYHYLILNGSRKSACEKSIGQGSSSQNDIPYYLATAGDVKPGVFEKYTS